MFKLLRQYALFFIWGSLLCMPAMSHPAVWVEKDSLDCRSTGEYDNPEIHYMINMVFRSLEVRFNGEMSLNQSAEQIVSVSAGSYLEVKERRWFTTRELRVTGSADGQPQYRFWLNDHPEKFDEDARAWFAHMLPQVNRRVGIDAWQRIRQLIAENDQNGIFSVISPIGSDQAKSKLYLRTLQQGNLETAVIHRLITEAGQQVSSSSRLQWLLVKIAAIVPDEPGLTSALFESTRHISSSSSMRKAIVCILRNRSIDTAAAIAAADAIRSISSSSDKAMALAVLAKVCPPDKRAGLAYLDAAESVASSSNKASALISLIHRQDLPAEVWIGIAQTSETVSSSGSLADVLVAFAAQCPLQDNVLKAYVTAAKTIASSGDKSRALVALIQRPGMTETTAMEIARASETVSSSGNQEKILSELAPVCPVTAPVIHAYLAAVSKISSSDLQASALVALLQRNDLSPELLGDILKTANTQISSSSSRDRVINLVSQKMEG